MRELKSTMTWERVGKKVNRKMKKKNRQKLNWMSKPAIQPPMKQQVTMRSLQRQEGICNEHNLS